MDRTLKALGRRIFEEIVPTDHLYLATTTIDADRLAAPLLPELERRAQSVGYACFWNEVANPFDIDALTVAPIIKLYQEPLGQVDQLIMLADALPNNLTVRTNLTHFLSQISPPRILIVSRWMPKSVRHELLTEFESTQERRVQCFYLHDGETDKSHRFAEPPSRPPIDHHLTPVLVMRRRKALLEQLQ